MGEQSSIWFGAVLRADLLAILIGNQCNIQDNAVVHITADRPLKNHDGSVVRDERGHPVGTRLGHGVTVGHGAVIHACDIAQRVLIGMGAIVLDGACIGNDVIVAAGTLVPPGMSIPDGVLVKGNPAQIARALTEKDFLMLRQSAASYAAYAREYANE